MTATPSDHRRNVEQGRRIATLEAGNATENAASPMSGADLIAAERRRQIDAEGWTPEHDDEHTAHELVYAAVAYAKAAANDPFHAYQWPWAGASFKRCHDPIRNLVKAGALIAAEIDRLKRAASDV